MKLDKTACFIYADCESLMKQKIDNCKNVPNKSSTINIGKYIPSRYLMSTISTFHNIENKHSLYIDYIVYIRKCFVFLL